jgi:prepilin-type N-terminal cleavage/methylation domain-containing protein
MIEKIKKQKGFTLIELLIAMSIFLIFLVIVIGSYTGIVRAQRDANEHRIMYVEARKVFDSLVWELRDGVVDYSYYQENNNNNLITNGGTELVLVSKDGDERTKIEHRYSEDDGGVVVLKKASSEDIDWSDFDFSQETVLNDPSRVSVEDFKMFVSPSGNPYDLSVDYNPANQFHPQVTVYAKFKREISALRSYEMVLQTTVSSRIYNQVY